MLSIRFYQAYLVKFAHTLRLVYLYARQHPFKNEKVKTFFKGYLKPIINKQFQIFFLMFFFL